MPPFYIRGIVLLILSQPSHFAKWRRKFNKDLIKKRRNPFSWVPPSHPCRFLNFLPRRPSSGIQNQIHRHPPGSSGPDRMGSPWLQASPADGLPAAGPVWPGRFPPDGSDLLPKVWPGRFPPDGSDLCPKVWPDRFPPDGSDLCPKVLSLIHL